MSRLKVICQLCGTTGEVGTKSPVKQNSHKWKVVSDLPGLEQEMKWEFWLCNGCNDNIFENIWYDSPISNETELEKLIATLKENK